MSDLTEAYIEHTTPVLQFLDVRSKAPSKVVAQLESEIARPPAISTGPRSEAAKAKVEPTMFLQKTRESSSHNDVASSARSFLKQAFCHAVSGARWGCAIIFMLSIKAVFFSTVLFAPLLTGCASQLNLKNVEFYTDAGLTHLSQENYLESAEAFYRANVNAELANASAKVKSLTRHNYGNALALLGEFPEGEQALREAVTFQKQATGGSIDHEVLRSLSVLARVSYDQSEYESALPYYREALAIASELNVDKEAPGDILAMTQEALECARKSFDKEAESSFRQKLESLLSTYGASSPTTAFDRFTKENVADRKAGRNLHWK